MEIRRFEARGLAQYSYVVACPETRTAVAVDPRRDVDVYLEHAAAAGLEISAVLETHVHADYASGAHELARQAGVPLHLSGHDAGETYEVSFPHRDLRHGDELSCGTLRVRALHTPGHTPEHLSFLLYDGGSEEPAALLSGDFLFVGSLGRPDLLGEAAKRELAERMFDSVREGLAGLPDELDVLPGHGAGSMCGAGMGSRPTTTLGMERATNPYLDPALPREALVAMLLERVPPFPPYYRRMKRVNAEGPPILGGLPGLEPLELEAFRAEREGGATVVDVRGAETFGEGHVPGALHIGAGVGVSEWAAWTVPYDTPILLVAEDAAQVEPSVRSLVRVGLDPVRGWLGGGFEAWRQAELPVARTPQVRPEELRRRMEREEVVVLDVRTEEEWRDEHVPGSVHVMAGELAERLDEVPDGGRSVAALCTTGYRSSVATSVLERAGRREVWNVAGGLSAWKAAGLPVERG